MLTGITDADVSGRSVDLDRLERALCRAEVRIAHNASFDIVFLHNLLPRLACRAWACSADDFDWPKAGFDGRQDFSGAHRAMANVMRLLPAPKASPGARDACSANSAVRDLETEIGPSSGLALAGLWL